MTTLVQSFRTGWRALIFCFLFQSAFLPFVLAGQAMEDLTSQAARIAAGAVVLVSMITWLGFITPRIIAVCWHQQQVWPVMRRTERARRSGSPAE